MNVSSIFHYVPHDRTHDKLSGNAPGPVKNDDHHKRHHSAARFNAWLAVKVTRGVGTMWCAYAFAVIALISLPQAISSHSAVTLVSWISQTFLQLVLLSIIIVGQNVLAGASDARAEATYHDAEAVLHESVAIQEHLLAQDGVLASLIARLGADLAQIEGTSGATAASGRPGDLLAQPPGAGSVTDAGEPADLGGLPGVS
jgi:hypothetical protein